MRMSVSFFVDGNACGMCLFVRERPHDGLLAEAESRNEFDIDPIIF